jgi:hypothetical protein
MAATRPFWSGQEISRTAVWRMAGAGGPVMVFCAIINKIPLIV